MKIAVNTRLLLKGRMEGIGWFAYETLKRIVIQHPEHTFYFIFDRKFDKDFVFADNVIPVVIGPQSRHPFLWYLWFEWSLPRVLKKLKPDVFFSPEGYASLHTNVAQINVMHDIAYEHYPETVPALVKLYYRYFFPKYSKKVKLVGTVSEFSKADIVKYYKIPPEKIRVVYNGVNEAFLETPEYVNEITRKKWTNGEPYFVFVGGLQPRKNLKNLILAFNSFKQKYKKPFKLVLVGKKAYKSDELEKLAQTLTCKDDIIFTGRIESLEEVNKLISAAYAMTYISVFEGFGIPCLEAMRCGTAVITSQTSSMPEVCEDAAFYVDPFSVESISCGMLQLAENENLRAELISKGKIQQQKFSWQKTADEIWKMIEEVNAQNN